MTSPTASPAPSSVAPSPSPSTPSALEAVAPFLDAARLNDGRIRTAARLINGGISATTIEFDARTKKAVADADPRTVQRAIPAGVPQPLMRAALVVYSDLVARASAFNRVSTWTKAPVNSVWGQDLLDCLKNGSAAAARYPNDLATLAELARKTPLFPAQDRHSKAGAEIAVRADLIGTNNNGCDSCGGQVLRDWPSITWSTDPSVWGTGSSTGYDYYGTIADIPFRARWTAGDWSVELNVC